MKLTAYDNITELDALAGEWNDLLACCSASHVPFLRHEYLSAWWRTLGGGEPVFAGTRVPVRNLVDYLEHGSSLDEFLTDFPSVTRDQAVSVLEMAREAAGREAATG